MLATTLPQLPQMPQNMGLASYTPYSPEQGNWFFIFCSHIPVSSLSDSHSGNVHHQNLPLSFVFSKLPIFNMLHKSGIFCGHFHSVFSAFGRTALGIFSSDFFFPLGHLLWNNLRLKELMLVVHKVTFFLITFHGLGRHCRLAMTRVAFGKDMIHDELT